MEIATPVRRDLHFPLAPERICDWHREGVYVSQWYNTLSLYFPEGERFFIHSVRAFRDQVSDPSLQAAITGFIGQEAMHGREHQRYNDLMDAAGLPSRRIEEGTGKRLAFVKQKLSPASQLAMTLAMEHLTALMAGHYLRNSFIMDGSVKAYQQIWRWHALEETEHKAVAYDLWKTVMPNTLGSYFRRVGLYLLVTADFWRVTAKLHRRMLAATPNRGSAVKGYWKLFHFLMIRPGAWLRLMPGWFAYLKPGFHPWEDDNRHSLGELPALEAELGVGNAP